MWQDIVRKWLQDQERGQAWLARKAGYSESYVSLVLNGKQEPSVGFLYSLEAAMGIDRGVLVDARTEGAPA